MEDRAKAKDRTKPSRPNIILPNSFYLVNNTSAETDSRKPIDDDDLYFFYRRNTVIRKQCRSGSLTIPIAMKPHKNSLIKSAYKTSLN